MSITCKFLLSRSSNIYYSGEEIAGLLTIYCSKERQFDAILLEFYGNSTVQWCELDKSEENIMHNDYSTHDIINKVFYKQQQKHVCQQQKLDLTNSKQLQRHVEYTFNFTFQVPKQAPGTYSCFYGRTEYGLRLQMRRIKKVDKQFHQRIIIKNKLDLTQCITNKKACAVYRFNDCGQISLKLPCTGFTPGQNIPYHIKYETKQANCKLLIQFNCYITCQIFSSSNKFKQIKQIINHKKHLSTEISSFVNIPLHCHTSSINDPEMIIKIQYLLEAMLINNDRKVLLEASIPLLIGTTPCFVFDGKLDSFMCFVNRASTFLDTIEELRQQEDLDWYSAFSNKSLESQEIFPLQRQDRLRKSISQCYKKFKEIYN